MHLIYLIINSETITINLWSGFDIYILGYVIAFVLTLILTIGENTVGSTIVSIISSFLFGVFSWATVFVISLSFIVDITVKILLFITNLREKKRIIAIKAKQKKH